MLKIFKNTLFIVAMCTCRCLLLTAPEFANGIHDRVQTFTRCLLSRKNCEYWCNNFLCSTSWFPKIRISSMQNTWLICSKSRYTLNLNFKNPNDLLSISTIISCSLMLVSVVHWWSLMKCQSLRWLVDWGPGNFEGAEDRGM